MILDLTSEAAMQAGSGPTGASHVLVVTNDRELRERLHVKGARTVPLQWLMNRLDLPVIASAAPRQQAGADRAPVGPRVPRRRRGDDDRPGLEARPRRDDEDRARRARSRATSGTPATTLRP